MALRRTLERRRQQRAARHRRLVLEQYESRMLLTGIAPIGQDVILTAAANSAYVFTANDFHFSDANDNPVDLFIAVKISTLPLVGSLTINGKAISAGDFVPVQIINAGQLQFAPAANATGIAYASFTFQVQDSGDTFNGGENLDPTPNTVTFNVVTISHAPVGQNHAVSAVEDTSFKFSTSDFPFSDPSDAASGSSGNNLAAVRIVTVPVFGRLTLLDGSADLPVSVGQLVAASDITAGKLRFLGLPNAWATPYTSFTFQVQDDGSTALGGVNLDPVPRTQTISVVPVNDAPSGQPMSIFMASCPASTTHAFSASDFGFTDLADFPNPNSMAAVIIVSPPAAGGLTYQGQAVQPLTAIPVGNLSQLVFTQPVSKNPPDATFTFEVKDNGGMSLVTGSDGSTAIGLNTDPNPKTITIRGVPAPSLPSVSHTTTVTSYEDVSYFLRPSDFRIDNPDANLVSVKIVATPALGTLNVHGVALKTGDVLTVADIAAGYVYYAPPPDANSSFGTPLASFAYTYRDDGGLCWDAINYDSLPFTIAVNVTPVNDPPVGQDRTVTINEDHAYAFQAGDFPMTDPADSPQNTLSAVRIATLPFPGGLTLNGMPVAVGQVISKFDLSNLAFTPGANQNDYNTPSPRFTFQVQDNGGAGPYGSSVDPSPNTFTFRINSVNDAPRSFDNRILEVEDNDYLFQTSDFPFADPSDNIGFNPGDALAAVIITSLPMSQTGELLYSGFPAVPGQKIPINSISQLLFRPAPNTNGAPAAAFTFRVQDTGGTATVTGSDGSTAIGIDSSPWDNTITINVTPVNDAPLGQDKTVTTPEDTAYPFKFADFNFSDPLDAVDGFANNLVGVRIASLPAQGTLLTSDGVPAQVGDLVPATAIITGQFRYVPLANEWGEGLDHFLFQVKDDGGTLNGGVDLDPTPRTMTVNVTSVNDAPRGTDRAVGTAEDTTYVIAPDEFGFSDPNDSPPNNFRGVVIGSLPSAGVLSDRGMPVTVGQTILIADVAAGMLQYTPTAGAVASPLDSFTFRVQDDGGVFGGGIDTDVSARMFSFNLASFCGRPVANIDATVSALEDAPYVFAAADFSLQNVDLALATVVVATLPSAGTLRDGGAVLRAGDIIPASDVASGLVTFTPPPDGNGSALAALSVEIDDGFGCGPFGTGTITVNVRPVNDPPSFVVGDNRTALDTDGPRVVGGWVKQSSAGPSNEADQHVLFLVKNDNPSLFVAQPAVDAAGRLTFEPAVGASGAANVTIKAVDDGGTGNGGVDQSGEQTFTIGVALAEPQHNRVIPADVTGDGRVVAADVLDVINYINTFGPGAVPAAQPGDPPPALYYDVTGDNRIASDDVIAIINYINAHPVVNPESTELPISVSSADTVENDALYAMLALDSAQQAQREAR